MSSPAAKAPPRLRPRYRLDGSWFKGALHTHTTASDGRFSLDELVRTYRDCGYAFVAVTDHMRLSRVGGMRDGLLLLDGIELHGPIGGRRTLHAVAIEPRLHKGEPTGTIHHMIDALLARNTIVLAAHPHWSANSFTDLERHPFPGIEIYNYASRRECNKGHGLAYWDHLLGHGRDVLGFAVDDTHGNAGLVDWNGGWIAVNASGLTKRDILAAIRRGNFYSSSGPAITDIAIRDGMVDLVTSPVVGARLIGRNGYSRRVWTDEPVTHLSLRLPSATDIARKWVYARIEVEDERGQAAWTNTLFRPPRAQAENPGSASG